MAQPEPDHDYHDATEDERKVGRSTQQQNRQGENSHHHYDRDQRDHKGRGTWLRAHD